MSDIAISVIIPIFNVERYLDDCLMSVENQTLENIEVILVNDGSTDQSAEIAQKYLNRNPNFRMLEQENSGQGTARNSGLNVANGEYVYFLDGDDYIADNALELLYNRSKEQKLDILKFAAYTFEDGDRKMSWTSEGGYKYCGTYDGVYTGTEALRAFIDNREAGLCSNCLMLIRRDIIQSNRLRYIDGIIYEDNLFYLELMLSAARVAVWNEPLYYRRIRAGSTTQTKQYLRKWQSFIKTIIAADEFVDSYVIEDLDTAGWYVIAYHNAMLHAWYYLSDEEKNSNIVRENMDLVRPIVMKYRHCGNLRHRLPTELYLLNKGLYRLVLNIISR